MNNFKFLQNNTSLFNEDITNFDSQLIERVQSSRFLIVGGAGSIGQSLVKQIFLRGPKLLHVVDINENNLVELVRDLRSSIGYFDGEFKTFAIDCGSIEFDLFMSSSYSYDYIFNLSALKHVRSEKDPFTLMRMIQVNVCNSYLLYKHSIKHKVKKYFCVSSDKAANPHNLMGATKKIMENVLFYENTVNISSTRFANVAFSDGSLLHGFNQRLRKKQPIAAPNDIKRYFINDTESGQLCLLSGLLGMNKEIFIPKFTKKNLYKFSDIAEEYLNSLGFDVYECQTEEEARTNCSDLIKNKKWPCLFFKSDTTGEKNEEEFFTNDENVNNSFFKNIGIVLHQNSTLKKEQINYFFNEIDSLYNNKKWDKNTLISLIKEMVPELVHDEKNKNLDEKM